MVTAITPRLLISQSARCGADPEKVIQEAGLSRSSLQRTSDHIPVEKMHLLWDSVLKRTHDQMFGLHAAERVPFGEYRLLDYIMASASSPLQALLLTRHSFNLLNSAFLLVLRWKRNLVHFELHNPSSPEFLPRPYIEYIFVNFLVRLRVVTQTRLRPIEVSVTCRKPESDREYDRVFGALVRFGGTVNSMVFTQDQMGMSLPFADPELFELLESYTKRKLHSLGTDSTLYNIRRILQEGLRHQGIGLSYVSNQLAMSPRGLQRVIFERGTTFREILDEVRREQAIRLLDEVDLPISEIASRLGFGSVSSFSHACQRWTGSSPHAYRKHGRCPQ